MKSNKSVKRIIALALFIIGFSQISWSQSFPVDVQGQIIPPYNMRFADYFDSQANSLIFTLELQDPVKETRNVRLRLSVESNGAEILGSNPNFQPEIITLEKNIPQLFTGNDLQLYFQNILSQNNNIPEYLPEGFNGICVEVLDIETNRVISNKGCATGFFNFSNPPQLQSPVCGIDIEQTETQNILFNWMAMHHASGNPITEVQYEFRLVEVPSYIQNPKDAFDLGNSIFQNTYSNVTSFFYTESEPLLEQGKNYAWRVKASAIDPLTSDVLPLFENNGFSEICTFGFSTPAIPPDPINFSTCVGNQCNYSASIGDTPKGEGYFQGDKVNLGYFELKFATVDYNNSDESYTGTGTIFVEFLGTNVQVEFSDIKINSFDRVSDGEIKAIIGDESVLPSDFVGDFTPINPTVVGLAGFSDDAATSLSSFFEQNPTQLISTLKQQGQEGNAQLPIGFDTPIPGLDKSAIITISDMKFTARKAEMNCIHVNKETGDIWSKFGGKGICIRQKGLVDDAPRLYILDEVEIASDNGFAIILETKNGQGDGTYMEWNCNGFQTYHAQGRHELDEEKIQPSDNNEKVFAQFSTPTNNLSEFKAEIINITPFHINGLAGFDFEGSTGWIDFSKEVKLSDTELAEGSTMFQNKGKEWMGIYLNTPTVALPSIFNIGNDLEDEAITATTDELILDTDGLTTDISINDILKNEEGGNVAGMALSLDKLNIKIDKNQITDNSLEGSFALPILDEGQMVSFTGGLVEGTDLATGEDVLNIELVLNQGSYPSELLRSTLNIGDNSKLSLRQSNGLFQAPKIELNGNIAININPNDLGFGETFDESLAVMESLLEQLGQEEYINQILAPQIPIENFTLDYNADVKLSFLNDMGLGNIDLLGLQSALSAIEVKELDPKSNTLAASSPDVRDIGLVLTSKFAEGILGDLTPDISFIIRLEEDSREGLSYNFSGFEIDGSLPEFELPTFNVSCSSDLPEIDITNQNGIANLEEIETIKVGYFDITDWMNITANGSGRFTGEGKINIPALGPLGNISVEFDNVLINEEGRVVDGIVQTKKDAMFTSTQLSDNPTELVNAIQSKIDAATNTANELFSLPLVLGVKADGSNEENQGLIITSLDFNPEGANMSAKVLIPVENNEFAEFSATGLNIVPDGIAGIDLIMGLANDFSFSNQPGQVPLQFERYQNGTGSFISLDCGGLVEFNLKGKYTLPNEDYTNISNPNQPLEASFNINTPEWGEFIGEIQITDEFEVVGLEDFSFKPTTAFIDYSTLSNPENIEFPEGYENTDRTWQGLYLPTVGMNIPAALSNGEISELVGEHLFIDNNGLSTNFTATNLIDLGTADLGGWNFSMDNFSLIIEANTLKKGSFSGGIQLPIMKGEETMPYEASYQYETLENGTKDYDIDFKAIPTEIEISLLQSRIEFDTTSIITIGRSNGEWTTPYASLSGDIKFDIEADESDLSQASKDILAQIDQFLKDNVSDDVTANDIIPKLKSEGIRFDNMVFDLGSTDNKFSIGGITPVNTSVEFLGMNADLSGINLASINPDTLTNQTTKAINENAKYLGFNFETKLAEDLLAGLAPTIKFSLNIQEEPLPNGKVNYDFFDYNFEFIPPTVDFACNDDTQPLQLSEERYKGSFSKNDKIDVGYFKMRIAKITSDNGNGKISGQGVMDVPVLGPLSKVRVRFKNIEINKDRKLVKGRVISVRDEGEDWVESENLQGLLATASEKLNSSLNQFKLPLVMGDTEEDGYSFIMVGLIFSPRRSNLQARLIVDLGNDEYAEFFAEGLNVVPTGIKGVDLRLGLAKELDLTNVADTPLIFEPYDEETETGSYALIDCDGFQSFNLKGKYVFDENTYTNLENPNDPVEAAFSFSTEKWGEFIAQMESIDSFSIAGIEDFGFKTSTAFIDYSSEKNPIGMTFPEAYTDTLSTWKGVYIPAINVGIPESLSGTENSYFSSRDMLVDQNGISAHLVGENVLDMNDGDLAGWNFSMDSIYLNIDNSQLVDGGFKGGIRLPIMKGEENMPYESTFSAITLDNGTSDYDVNFKAVPKEVDVSLLQSSISFDESSIFTVGRENGEWQLPYLKMSGKINFDIDADANSLPEEGQEILAEITEFLMDNGLDMDASEIIPKLKSEGIRFENFVLDMGNDTSKFSIESITPINTSIEFLGANANLSEINFAKVSPDSLIADGVTSINENAKYLGFTFETKIAEDLLGGLAPTVKFALNIEEEPLPNGKVNYDFFSYDLDFIPPSVNFACTNNLEELNISQEDYTGSLAGIDSLQIGHFWMTGINLTSDNDGIISGTGVIRVPVLGPLQNLNVSFTDATFNKDKQLKSGEIVTSSEDGSWSNTPDLNGLLGKASEKIGDVANSFELPLIMGDTEEDGYAFTIVGLSFQPTETKLKARLLVELAEDEYAEFFAEGLNIVPDGIAGVDIRLGLAADLDLKGSTDVPLIFNKYENESGSYALCDCDGFQVFSLEGKYVFDENDITNLENPNEPVEAAFSFTTEEWGQFTGQIEAIDSFAIVGMDGFGFKATSAYIDYSTKGNISDMPFPEDYTDTLETWQGVYIPEIRVDIPESFTGGEKSFFIGENLLLDSQGASANLYGENILSINDGDLAGWAFSMDSVYINIANNTLENGGFKGGIQLPIMVEGESMPYEASFTAVSDSTGVSDYDMNFQAIPQTIDLSLLSSTISFDDSSIFTVGRENGEWQLPYLEMSGNINFDINTDPDSLSAEAQQVLADITEFLVDNGVDMDASEIVPKLKSEGIRFENFILDMGSDSSKFSIEKITPVNSSIEFLGMTVNLSDIDFTKIDPDSLMADVDSLVTEGTDLAINTINENAKYLGFTFETKIAEDLLGGLAPTVKFALNIEEEPLPNGEVNYNFFSYDLDFEAPNVDLSCTSNLEPLVIGEDSYTGTLAENDSIQVGRFKMKIDEVTGTNGSFAGKGTIEVPVLGPVRFLKVAFEDLDLDAAKTMKSGSVVTQTDGGSWSSTPEGLTGLMATASEKINSAMSSFELPVIMGDVEEDGYAFTIMGLNFGRDKASLEARFILDVGDDTYAEFVAQGLEIVPTGIASIDINLGLASDLDLTDVSGIPLTFKAYDTDNETGSYVKCDCDGFQSFNLEGLYRFDENGFTNIENPEEPVTASFSLNTETWGEFLGQVEAIDTFAIVGMDDFKFKTTTAYLDYSASANAAEISFPEGYTDTLNTWQGLYIPEIRVDIPESFTGGEKSFFIGENLLLDSEGVSANLYGENILSINDGDLAGWAFSMDSVYINIANNTLENGGFKGGIQLPIMVEGESMPYEASFTAVSDSTGVSDYDMNFQAIPQTIDLSLLSSTISFDDSSIFTVGRENGEWQLPYLEMSGNINFDINTDPDSLSAEAQQVLADITEFLVDNGVDMDASEIVPKLKSEGIRFENFILDMGSDSSKFSIEKITPVNSSIEFLGMTANLSDIDFTKIDLDSLMADVDSLVTEGTDLAINTINENAKYLGFTFETKIAEDLLGGLAPTVKFALNIEEEPLLNGEVNYNFFSYDLDFIPPSVNFACTNNLEELNISQEAYSGLLAGIDSLQVGHFWMSDINLTNDNDGIVSGTGVIRVPVLGPLQNLNVSFTDAEFNNDLQLKSGEIVTSSEGGSWTTTPDLNGLLGKASEKIGDVANSFELPLVMGDTEEDGYAFTIVGLSFQPTETKLKARLLVELVEDEYAEFFAEGLNIIPDGIAGMDIRMGLAADLNLEGSAGIPLIFNKYEDENGSYALCDCDGFQSFQLEGKYVFGEDYKNLENPNEPVEAAFNFNTEAWGEFIGQVEEIDSFAITGMDGFGFKASSAYLDYSKERNAIGMTFPKDYTDTLNTWKGIYIPEIRVDIPESFTGGTAGYFTGQDLLLDSMGMSANMVGENILNMNDGDMAGWKFSMDSIYVNISNNVLETGGFKGGIRLPIMVEGESMPYEASFTAVSDSTGVSDYDMNFQAIPVPLDISLLKSTITFDENSIFTVGRENGEWQLPYLEMSGNINFNIDFDANSLPDEAQESLAEVTTFLVDNGVDVDATDIVPRFQSEGIRFENFILDMNSDTSKFSIGAITPINTSLGFLGMEANLSDIDFTKINPDSLMADVDSLVTEGTDAAINAVNENAKYLGFSFETKLAEDLLGGLAPTVRFSLNIEEEPLPNGEVNYNFFSYDFDFEAPDVNLNCTSNLQPLVIEEDDFLGTLAVNDKVKVGRFEMEISELNQTGNTYSGKGIIEVPVLGPVRFLKVDFNELEINFQKEMKSGNVVTKTDGGSWSSTPEGLSGLMATASDKINSAMSSFELPVIMGDVEEDGVAFMIVGLNFGKEKASLEARLVIDMGEGEYAEFKAQGLEIVPTGIANIDINLGLATDLNMENLTGLPIIFNQYDENENTGSFATCDCDGFQSFQLEGKYVFGEDYKNLENPNEPVEAAFNFNTEAWGEFIGQVEEIDSFAIAGMDGFGFKASSAYLDYSKERNVTGMTFPEDYTDTLNTWKGIYIPEIRVDIPESFTGGTAGYFTGQDLLLDSLGMSANMVGENILDMNDGDMAGWKFSMDSIYVNISNNVLETGGFKGGIRLPIMVEGESMPYEASFTAVSDSTGVSDYDMNFQAIPVPLDISLLKSTITFDENSIFTVGRQNGEWQLPYLEMSGNINFDIDTDINSLPESAQESLAEVTAFLVENGADVDAADIIPKFKSEGIRFENFILDMNSDTSKFSIGAIAPVNTSLEFLGMKADLGGINFLKLDADSLVSDATNAINENAKYLGFSFETKIAEDLLGALAPTVSFSLNIEEEPITGSGVNYNFYNYDLDFKAPDVNFSCANTEALSIINTLYSGQLAGIDSLQVGHFWMRDIDLTSDNNGVITGTGKIRVPILGPLQNLNVSFTDATFNTDKQLMLGEIVTSSEGGSWATTPDLNGLMGKASEKIGDVANSFSLPLIMGDTSDGYVFTFVGLSFQPQETKLKARLLVDVGEDTYAEFFAEGLNVVPNGIAGVDLRLGLAENLDLQSLTGAPLSFKKYETADSTGSFAVCDCDGFQSFRLDGSYILDKEEYKNIENPENDVAANFSIYTETWGEFLGKVESIDSFEIVGVDGFTFSSTNAYIDFSKSQNNIGMIFPEGYTNTGVEWKGFYMAELNVGIPSSFTGGQPGSFTGKDLMIDNGGVTARLVGENVLDMNDGDMAGWKFSMDSIYLNIDNNELENGGFKGGIRLPIMIEGESMPYQASFVSVTDSIGVSDYDMNFQAIPVPLDISLLKSTITFDENSIFTVGRKNREWQLPYLEMSGNINFDIDADANSLPESAQEVLADISEFLLENGLDVDASDIIPKFKSEGIRFDDFILDMNSDSSKFSIGAITPVNTGIEFLGSSANLSGIDFLKLDADSLISDATNTINNNAKYLGFSFETKVAEDFLGGLAPTVRFSLNIEEEPIVDGKVNYNFYNYDLEFEAPDVDMSCRSDLPDLVIKQDNYDQTLSIGDSLTVGRFQMSIAEITSDNGTGVISGKGVVDVPVLGPLRNLNVEFTDIIINSDKQMRFGSMVTKSEDGNWAAPSANLKGLMGKAADKISSGANSFELPVVMGNPEEDGYAFTIVGLNFGVDKTSLEARFIVKTGEEDDDYLEFKANGLNIVPTGIAGVDLRLVLANEFSLEGATGVPLKFAAYSDVDDTGSYVLCDCDGFQSFNLSGDVELPKDIILSRKGLATNEEIPVTAAFSITSESWGEFMGELVINDTTFIPGIEDMPIILTGAYMDLSTESDPELLQFPEGYEGASIDGTWTGFYMPAISMQLPEALSSTSEENVPLIEGLNFVMDSTGFSGRLLGTNLISADVANIGGLGFSMDSVIIELTQNNLQKAQFLGGIQLPMMEEDEMMPYEGNFFITQDSITNENFLDFSFEAKPEEVRIDLLRSTFSFDSTSVISIVRENGAFSYPIIDLSGSFKLDIASSDDAFSEEFLADVAEIEEMLDMENLLPQLNLDSITFKHFRVDPNSEDQVFSIDSIVPMGFELSFLGMDWDMSEITFDEVENLGMEIANTSESDVAGAIKDLGLAFDFELNVPLLPKIPASFAILIDEKKENGKVSYSFEGFEFDYTLPKLPSFTCDSEIAPDSITDQTAVAMTASQNVKVGRFQMKVENLESSNASGNTGTGTIQIPFLGYEMKVSFDGIQVNAAGQIIAGEILTDTEASLISDEAASTEGTSVPFIGDSPELESFLQSTQEFFTLPISISEKLKEMADIELPEGLDLILLGLSFNNERAQMNISVSIPTGTEGQNVYFGARGLDIRPDGIDLGELKLFLVQDIGLAD